MPVSDYQFSELSRRVADLEERERERDSWLNTTFTELRSSVSNVRERLIEISADNKLKQYLIPSAVSIAAIIAAIIGGPKLTP